MAWSTDVPVSSTSLLLNEGFAKATTVPMAKGKHLLLATRLLLGFQTEK